MTRSKRYTPQLQSLTIRGSDACDFMQGYVTSELRENDENVGQPMAVTDIKGRVLANGWTLGSTNSVSLFIDRSVTETISAHLKKYMIFSKSLIEEETPDVQVVAEGMDHARTLLPLQWNWSVESNFEDDLNSLSIKDRLPIVTAETSGLFLPQMLGLTSHGAVNFAKGCYLGQEIVARAEHRGAVKKQLASYRWDGESLEIGEKLMNNGRSNGSVVAVDDTHALVVVSGPPNELRSDRASLFLEN